MGIKKKHHLGDYLLVQYQIIRTNIATVVADRRDNY